MSQMTTNASSEDTLIRDSQISGFSAFRERLGFCCCRLFKRSSTYDLSSKSKHDLEQQNKPPYVDQALQGEKQARKEKLEKIARTLPGATPNLPQLTGLPRSPTHTTSRSLTTSAPVTPRSGINLIQTRPPINTLMSKTGISTGNKPSPLAKTTKDDKKETDETTDSSEEESSSEDNKSSDSDNAPTKRAPNNRTNNRR